MENVKEETWMENTETVQDFHEHVVIFSETAEVLYEMLTGLSRESLKVGQKNEYEQKQRYVWH